MAGFYHGNYGFVNLQMRNSGDPGHEPSLDGGCSPSIIEIANMYYNVIALHYQ